MYHVLRFLSIFFAMLPQSSFAASVVIADFAKQGLGGWQDQIFKGRTQYQLMRLDGKTILRANSRNSASGKIRKLTVNLEKTPYLYWNWRLDRLPWPKNSPAETRRDGDDYGLRIYVIVSGGGFFWRTKAINYVWSRHQPINHSWPNAYSNKAVMLAVDSGEQHLGKWRHYRRNILSDFQRVFGIRPKEIHAVAIMTDTDNTGAQIEAYYGNIYFSDK